MIRSNPNYRRRPVLKAVALVLFLSIPSMACNMEFRGATSGPGRTGTAAVIKKDIVVPVEAEHPTRGKISAYYDTWSHVEAERKVDVAAESDGVCAGVLVEAGDVVKQGDVLAQLEQEEAQAALQQAEIQVKQTKSAYDLAREQHQQGVGNKLDMDNALYAYQQSESTVKVQEPSSGRKPPENSRVSTASKSSEPPHAAFGRVSPGSRPMSEPRGSMTSSKAIAVADSLRLLLVMVNSSVTVPPGATGSSMNSFESSSRSSNPVTSSTAAALPLEI